MIHASTRYTINLNLTFKMPVIHKLISYGPQRIIVGHMSTVSFFPPRI